MNLYTIGFVQKSAEDFFSILSKNKIDCVIDIRLNNSSQLAGFTKAKDLCFFLNKIANISYIHNVKYAPTKEILDNYKKNKITWEIYENEYKALIEKRQVEKLFLKDVQNFQNICLLCSESEAYYCHRRLLAEYLNSKIGNIVIQHL